MKGRSSKPQTKIGMEIDNPSKVKDGAPLSGAYIRSLVKQLTSSRTKDPMNPKNPDSVDSDGLPCRNFAKFGEGFSDTQQTPPPQQHKKQVRRRLHTSRPYQERLLNMAEARREIVTALKFHRAAMKQAQEQQQSPPLQPPPQPCFEQETKVKSRRNPRIYPSVSGTTAGFTNYLDNFSYSSLSPPPPPNPYSWPAPPLAPKLAENLNLNFTLPNQALGLNLNFQDFSNIDASLYQNNNYPSIYSSSSPSSSTSPSFSIATEEVSAVSQDGPSGVVDETDDGLGGGLHPAMDDEEMAEIRSIGEQHQMEWNDTMNLVTSAWWFKFMKSMEFGPEMKIEDDGYHPFDEAMEFPAWLNANDGCFHRHFNYNCSKDSLEDPALPCMDIGEFEGMDGDWLA